MRINAYLRKVNEEKFVGISKHLVKSKTEISPKNYEGTRQLMLILCICRLRVFYAWPMCIFTAWEYCFFDVHLVKAFGDASVLWT